MLTEIDEGKGIVKSSWGKVRKKVQKVDPEFVQIVDEINPDKSFPVFLAYYPYGALIGDTANPFMPDMDSSVHRITDRIIPKDVFKHLGYGANSLPMGMLLDKQIEYFVDLPEERVTIPWKIYAPGKIFPFGLILRDKSNRNYAPNGILVGTAGARSAFLLPNIGCVTNHINLQRELNIYKQAPKSLYEHGLIFKEIVNSRAINSDWRCCILYFSEKWIEKIYSDKAWLKFKSYLLELAWKNFEYDRNQQYYGIIFSIILKKRNLKPNPYLTDTLRHLFTIALGEAPGYSPAIDNEALPIDLIQNIYLEFYGLKKYIPTVMVPKNYKFEYDKHPVYYSLQNPSTHCFSPKSRKISSTLFELRELEHITNIFIDELSQKNSAASDTVLGEVSKIIEFQYFHNEEDRHNIIKASSEIIKFDKNFEFVKKESSNQIFSEDSKFVRGCVRIHKKS